MGTDVCFNMIAPSSTTEEKVIKNKLDELARTSQNPLFGIDVDDDELQDATMLKSSSEQFGIKNKPFKKNKPTKEKKI